MKTGDLARYNSDGELVHAGRVDFQIKIRGQRVETAEIENTIMRWSPGKISNCLVMKLPQSDDLLVAYIVSNDLKLNTEDIRDYCNKHLRQYMIPSYFIIMDKFLVNSNGKVDRKQFPLPSLQYNALTNSSRSEDRSMSELEEKVHRLWCSTLRLDAISRDKNCFALGGSSLSLMQFFNYYQFYLAPDKQLNVLDFFANPTITEHVQLLLNSKTKATIIWITRLRIGVTSFSQQRLWMDEKVRFNTSINSQISIYNELLIYKLISSTSLSTHRLRHALTLVMGKHSILRTALIYDHDKLIEKVLPKSDDLFDLDTTHLIDNNHLKKILYNEETNRSLFDLEQGRVFRCHILYRSLQEDNDKNLKQDDIIIFNFHHVAIDLTSIKIFIDDLRQALKEQKLLNNNEDNITYIDYAQYERLEDWSSARQYWNNVLATLDNSIYQQNFVIRSGKGYTVTFDLNHDLVTKMTHFISQSNLTLFQVGLAVFFAFLFKMSNSKQLDLCTGIVVANRSQYPLQSIIGFFANTLPFCLKIDPYESFIQLCHRVQQLWFNILPHSHLSYQEIIKLNPKLGSSFLRTMFLVETIVDNNEQNIEIDTGTTFSIIDRNLLAGNIAKFDMTCILHEHRQNETISVTLNASLDVYDKSTIFKMANRLKNIFDQLFSISSIYQFSLLLPHEVELLRDLNDSCLDYSQIGCIHMNFAYQTHLQPQKVAVVLDNGSMTYGELLYYAQQLANYLIVNCAVQSGQIVCQLIERSFEMIIGMIGIWMTGSVYTPLNVHDCRTRLNTCIQQTDTHIILVHQHTQNQLLAQDLMINVDQVISIAHMNEVTTTCIDYVNVTPEDISHIIFTTDLSGLVKAVQLRHRNFISTLRSNHIESTDTVLHHTSVNFDVHLLETIGTLIMGGQVILHHPNGNASVSCFSETIGRQQVTLLHTIPSLLIILGDYLSTIKNKNSLKTLRCVLSEGEPLMASTVRKILSFVNEHCRFYNCYGYTECTGTAVQYIDEGNSNDADFLPIGRPLSRAHIYLLDEYRQPVIPGVQTGEIFIGGSGLFYGYYGCNELTPRVLCNLNDAFFYKTGDLGWLNTRIKQLEFKEHQYDQVKLRNQFMEIQEIQRVLMKIVADCVVIKEKHKNTDYFIAYVQTTHTIEYLRHHCLTFLPLYMTPYIFIIVDTLPVDQNGKINQQNLPISDFFYLPTFPSEVKLPRTEMEQRVHKIWHQVLSYVGSNLSISTSFFSLRDDPKSFISLFNLYSINFNHNLRITTFIEQPTIAEHARLLMENTTLEARCDRSHSIDIKEGELSFRLHVS
ncbi:unnamed protein product [Rotaria sp. Silwood2]|nr:unnamed protein product [Rotaria sp. Silwood2]CAF4264085.1 unnamed protein product [Rotaria sp. Silwood2]